MYIFISHSSKDASVAQELCNVIEAGGSSCFLAPRDIRPGYEYATEIINGIDRSNVVLLLLSNNAMSSPHILREIERAVSKSIPIIVYKMEDVVLTKSYEYFLMSHQWLDAECCRYDALLKAIKDLDKPHTTDDSMDTVTVAPKKQKTQASNNKMIPIIIIGIIIIILLCVFIGIALMDSDDSTNINSNNTIYNVNENENEDNDDNEITTESNEATKSSETPSSDIDIRLGDSVVFGSYNGATISWRVLKISDDNTEAILVSKDILTFKAFDGADSGKSNFSSLTPDTAGSNIWKDSSIRAWLNSDTDSVKYEGKAPTDLSMSDGCNGYDMEAGFLYNFSNEEIAAIKETSIKTNGITTKDKVFLLSLDELELFDKAGVSLISVPTKEAIDNNESSYYVEYCQGVYKVDSAFWWLRDALENSDTDCYQVGPGAKDDENIYTSIACADGYGIRPAITVDLTKIILNLE